MRWVRVLMSVAFDITLWVWRHWEGLCNSGNPYFPNGLVQSCSDKRSTQNVRQTNGFNITEHENEPFIVWFQTPHYKETLWAFGVASRKNIHGYLKRLFKYSLFQWHICGRQDSHYTVQPKHTVTEDPMGPSWDRPSHHVLRLPLVCRKTLAS